jgi:hypothetical protein
LIRALRLWLNAPNQEELPTKEDAFHRWPRDLFTMEPTSHALFARWSDLVSKEEQEDGLETGIELAVEATNVANQLVDLPARRPPHLLHLEEPNFTL